jgi:hypothetical protein
MNREDLTAEYEAWLEANPNVPKLSADEALDQILRDEPEVERPEWLDAQITWLCDFIDRWEIAE